jgi:hypothetical protein
METPPFNEMKKSIEVVYYYYDSERRKVPVMVGTESKAQHALFMPKDGLEYIKKDLSIDNLFVTWDNEEYIVAGS